MRLLQPTRFCAGEHCRFCKVKATCRKRAEYNLAIAQYDFAPPDMLEDNEIEMILERADALVSWAADVKEYALSQALSGKQWNNVTLYSSSTAKTGTKKSGTYYLYDGQVVNSRMRITNSASNCGKTPAGSYVTGWVNKADI